MRSAFVKWGVPAMFLAGFLTACPAPPEPEPDRPPIASFTVEPESGAVGTTFTFDASASAAPDGVIVEYEWDFGDGNTHTGQLGEPEAQHTYQEAGEFEVTLTVTDDQGFSDSTSRTVEVTEIEFEMTGIGGYVTNATAGEAVEGSEVEVLEAGTDDVVATATTDGDGTFALELEPGHYDLRLEQEGYAGSQVLNVRVVEQRTSRLHVVQMRAFNPDWSTTPPAVEIGGVEDGDQYDGTLGIIDYEVNATPADDALSTLHIYAALDRMPGAGFTTLIRNHYSQTDSTGKQTIDPFDYAAQGDTTFEVVVYDTNRNRTHVIRYIEVDHYFIPEGGADALNPPPHIVATLAVTMRDQLEFFSLAAEPQAAPAGGNLFVELSWFDTEVYGYNIYRSTGGGEFEQIGTSPFNFHVDISPDLAPGQEVCYYVTGYVGTSQSPPSNVMCTTPLEMWDVQLVTPADDAQGVSLTPTFEWEPTDTVSDHHFYLPVVWDLLTGGTGLLVSPGELGLVNRTSYTWNEGGQYDGTEFATLAKGTTYTWQMFSAYATDHPTNPTAVSVAVDYLGVLIPPGLVRSSDVFTFTTSE